MSKKVGFAIGNGPSRLCFDIDELQGKGITVGCNHLFTEYKVDYIVALDEDNKIETLLDDFEKDFKFISRGFILQKRQAWLYVDWEPVCWLGDINKGYNNNSGVMAAGYLSTILKCDIVYLLGIDFFREMPGNVPTDAFPHITPETHFFPGLPRVWNQLADLNQHTEFIRVGKIPDYDREFFENDLNGFTFIDYTEFREILNGS